MLYLYCFSSTNTSVLAVELISDANNGNVSITSFSTTTFLFDIVIKDSEIVYYYLIPRFLALCIFNITDLILLHSLIFHR
jgi:hypothetical protein